MRNLNADEINCRVQIVKKNGFSLLLYKNARCDMSILDEEFGEMGWQRRHTNGNHNCIISVWDTDKEQWIEKEDTGAKSNMDADKGLASDSFKRAGFNWGIGRELYTAPFIWINAKKGEIYKKNNGKFGVDSKATFTVNRISTDDKVIQDLSIVDKNLDVRWKMHGHVDNDNGKEWLGEDMPEWKRIEQSIKSGKMKPNEIREYFKVSKANMKYFQDLAA